MIKSVTTMVIQSIKEVKKALNHSRDKVLNVYAHPQIAERLLNDEQKSLRELGQALNSRIIVLADPSLHREDVNITFVK